MKHRKTWERPQTTHRDQRRAARLESTLNPVQKTTLTDHHELKVGHYVTKDYQKPTQEALKVTEITDYGAIAVSRKGRAYLLNPDTLAELDIRKAH